jgi:hypothetical protein
LVSGLQQCQGISANWFYTQFSFENLDISNFLCKKPTGKLSGIFLSEIFTDIVVSQRELSTIKGTLDNLLGEGDKAVA